MTGILVSEQNKPDDADVFRLISFVFPRAGWAGRDGRSSSLGPVVVEWHTALATTLSVVVIETEHVNVSFRWSANNTATALQFAQRQPFCEVGVFSDFSDGRGTPEGVPKKSEDVPGSRFKSRKHTPGKTKNGQPSSADISSPPTPPSPPLSHKRSTSHLPLCQLAHDGGVGFHADER